jgi:hypothetical protein
MMQRHGVRVLADVCHAVILEAYPWIRDDLWAVYKPNGSIITTDAINPGPGYEPFTEIVEVE